MKQSQAQAHWVTIILGILVLFYTAYSYWNGGIAGKAGSIAVTRDDDPIFFWLALALMGLSGIVTLLYGVAQISGNAIWFTTGINKLVSRKR